MPRKGEGMKNKLELHYYTDLKNWTIGLDVFSINGDLYGEVFYVREKDILTFHFGPFKLVLWIWNLQGNETYA